MSSERMLRINELIRRELALLCERDIVPASRALVTVTAVKVTPDLRSATVFVSVLGDEEQQAHVLKLLHGCRQHWQHSIAGRVILKYTPVLKFKLDHSAENAERVLAILEELDIPPDEDTDKD